MFNYSCIFLNLKFFIWYIVYMFVSEFVNKIMVVVKISLILNNFSGLGFDIVELCKVK